VRRTTVRGPKFEVFGTLNPELRTYSRAFLAIPAFLASLASLALRSDLASNRGEVGIMPQDMVFSPYTPKIVLQKMPQKHTRGCQLLAQSSACGWFLSLWTLKGAGHEWHLRLPRSTVFYFPITSVSVPARATTSIRNRFLAPSPSNELPRKAVQTSLLV